jgi:putative endonuclease
MSATADEGCPSKRHWREVGRQELNMYYVYMLRSLSNPKQRYIGYTTNLKARMVSHNQGANKHTAKHVPWEVQTYVAFSSEEQAKVFENYLKTGSGFAFANKRLWPR